MMWLKNDPQLLPSTVLLLLPLIAGGAAFLGSGIMFRDIAAADKAGIRNRRAPDSVEAMLGAIDLQKKMLAHQPTSFSEGLYLTYGDADPQRQLYFKPWLRNKGREKEHHVRIDVKLMRGGTVIAEAGGPNASWTLKPEWQRFEFGLARPRTREIFTAKQLLRADGKTAVRMSIDGKLYETYPFTISGGKIQFQGRQVSQKTDRLQYIEGAQTSCWSERQ